MQNLSKSLYTKGLQCTKSLWLKKYKKEVLTPPGDQALSVFKTGDEVGDLACDLFPNGKEIPFNKDNIDGMITLTKQYLEEGVKDIYEATFKFDGVLVMVDILHINDDGSVEIYEVKSSTWNDKKKLNNIQKYIDDAAIQYYVLNGCGFDIKKTSIVLLNTDYIRGSELEIDKLFSIVDVTENVLALQETIPLRLQTFQDVLEDSENEPDVDIGWHCKNPYECDAMEYCWKTQRAIPDYSVFDIFSLTKKSKALSLYRDGIVKVEDIPDDFEMTEKQKKAVDDWKNQTEIVNKEEIKSFLADLKYPLYHFDFETYQNAIPSFEGTKAHEKIPFQYSLHIEYENGDIEHKEFLGKEGTDPREELVKRMVEDIPSDVSVLAFHSSFEKEVIENLAITFPAYKEHLLAIAGNLIDLEVPFKNKSYYVPAMKGRSSIKVVLPALVPEMEKAYKELELVQNGGDAMNVFPLLADMPQEKKDRYRCALLKYCELDTLAMVKVLEKLREVTLPKY
jgi:hypothetical protein